MGRFDKQIGVRLPDGLHSLVCRVAESRGEDLSDFVRRAIYKELAFLSFLPNNQKKALGVTELRKPK